MQRNKRMHVLGFGLAGAVITATSGCGDLVVSNLLQGAREGALTTTTGIIEGFFENQFGLEGEGDAEEEESGNGLFIGI